MLGFSYVGLIFLLMLIVPNMIWTRHKPEGYEEYAKGENRILLAFERVGEALVTCTALIFSDFNLRPFTPWSLWLAGAVILMILYEAYWARYFRSEKSMEDFYSSFLGVPVPGASLPVGAFVLLGIYGRNLWLITATLVLAVGHIGIHWNHRKEIMRGCAEGE